jgi:hypothetical protein
LCQITMVCSVALFLTTLTLQSQLTYAVGSNEQVNANADYGTFQAPSANVRPRFRYWLPDASVNSSQVADDIRDVGRVGAGGVELLGYYLYGNVQIFPGNFCLLQSDWTVNYFGSPAWSVILFLLRYRCIADTKGKKFYKRLCYRQPKRKGLWWTWLLVQIKEQEFQLPPNQMVYCGIYFSLTFPYQLEELLTVCFLAGIPAPWWLRQQVWF